MLDRSPALAELIARMTPDQFREHLTQIEALAQTDTAAFAELLYDWSFWGRPAQQEPIECADPECRCKGRWTVWLILAGRAWGKTRTGAETVNGWARKYPGCRIALVARSAGDARGVMIEGESGIVGSSPPWFFPDYEPAKLRITWPNGSQAAIFTAEAPDGPRGYQHHFYWADELAAWKNPPVERSTSEMGRIGAGEQCWNNLLLGHRLVARWDWPSDFRLRGLVTTTPRAIPLVKSLVKDEKTGLRPAHVHVTRGATYDNRSNLGPEFFDQIVSQYEGTRLGDQEIYGLVLDDNPGALWKAEMIDPYRVDEDRLPDQYTAVVGVDPASTASTEANRTGIVVVAAGPGPGKSDPDFVSLDEEAPSESLGAHMSRLNRMHGYVVQDASIKGTPDKWARKAVEMYHKWGCSCIVAESNQGGDMVKHTIHSVDPTIPVRLVHATKNKQTRAEPIVALYEQGRVHHLNPRPLFADLEKELLEWDPEISPKSPDRLDALVWGLHHLLVKKRVRYGCAPLSVGERSNPWTTSELSIM